MLIRALISAAVLATPIYSPLPALAQDVPPGACLLDSGEWCWPIAPLTYGDPCTCPRPDGTIEAGVVQ